MQRFPGVRSLEFWVTEPEYLLGEFQMNASFSIGFAVEALNRLKLGAECHDLRRYNQADCLDP